MTNQDFRSKLRDFLIRKNESLIYKTMGSMSTLTDPRNGNIIGAMAEKFVESQTEPIITLIDEGVPKKRTKSYQLLGEKTGYNKAIDDIRTNLRIKGE